MNQKEFSSLEIAHLNLWPVLRIASVVFAVIGMIVGIFAFLIFPHPSSVGLSFSTRLLSAMLFAVLYALIVTLGIGLVVWLYNVLSARLNWSIRFQISPTTPTKNLILIVSGLGLS